MAATLSVVGGTSTPEVNFTLTILGEGGTAEIYSRVTGLQGPGTHTIPKDGKLTITIKPKDGFDVDTVFIDDEAINRRKDSVYPLKVISDTEMVIRFKATHVAPPVTAPSIHTFNISIIGGEGTVEAVSKTWGATPFGPGEHSVPKGDKVTLMLTPKNGWATSLVNVSGTLMAIQVDNSYEVTVTGNTVVGIRFTQVKKVATHAPAGHGMPKIFEGGSVWIALALILTVAGALWYNAVPGKEISNQVDAQKMQDRCLEAAKEGFVLSGCDIKKASPSNSSSSPKGTSDVHSSCPGTQVGRFTVYDGTARKGCTITVTGENQARIKGNFTITSLKEHPYGAFINVACEDYEYRGAQATFVKQGDRNGHPCTVLALPSDAPTTAVTTITSL